ncbi:hypothetical protein JOM56_015430 [Amanita muscaria]
MNPYTQSSTVAPHLNSYGATADSLSQQHGDLLRMGIEDLLWIPSVARLFLNYNNLKDQCLDLSSTITAVTKTQTKMYDDVALLRLQLEEARWQVPPPASGYYANMNCSKMSPNRLDHRAAAATRFGNSSERPEQFPVAILWTFADAKKDAAVQWVGNRPEQNLSTRATLRTSGWLHLNTSKNFNHCSRSVLNTGKLKPSFKAEEEAGNGQLEAKRPCLSPSVSRSPKRSRGMSVTRPAAGSTTGKSNRIKTFTPTVALKAKSTPRSKPTGVQQSLSASNPTRTPRPRPRTAVGTAGLHTSTTGLDATGLDTNSLGATTSGTTGLDATGLGTTGLGATGSDETGGADLGAAIEKDTAGTMDPRAGADLTDNVDDNIKFNGPIDITFIKVTPTTDNLQSILAKRYPSYTAAIDLVKSLDLDSTVGRSIIAESVELFIRGVELADPRLQEYEEDDVGVSWGHYQLRGWREILPNWQAIGSPENARRLIAAVLKTCRVARALCHDLEMSERKIGSQTISYLSDNYLEQITEWLWELWKQAGGPLDKGKGKDLASTQLTSTSGSALSPSATQIETAAINREELAAALQSWDADKLKTLQKDELARVISAYKLSSSNVTRLTKPKLVETLLPALKSGPSEELVQDLYHTFQTIATAPRNARKKVVKG